MFAGARIRRLRRDLNLSQTQMADGLGISASYLNLVERDQRPLTAQLILKLAQTYDVNLRSLSDNDSTRVISDLREVFADPLLNENLLSPADLVDLATNSPATAQSIVTLYRAYRDVVERSAGLAERLAGGGSARQLDLAVPVEEVRDFSVSNKNHFPELEDAAAALWESSLAKADDPTSGLRRHLRALGVTVRVMPTEFMERLLRRFDRHSSRLFLSEVLPATAQRFQMAYQIALLEHAELLDRIVAQVNTQRTETRKLVRTMLASYFAGAVLMPYEPFLQAAEKKRYDIQALCHRFDVSFEQACHRLTTLQKPGAQGIPFFFIRIDQAGNISKRLAAGGFHFARFGGACPRWNVHEAFRNPGRILTQVVQMPDNTSYFSISRTVSGIAPGQGELEFAIGLGCELREAQRTIYADGLDVTDARLVTPIGLNCRLCERPDCGHRAFPPINRALVIDENMRTMSPYLFREVP
jgi:predicted transcriptional regulator/transcriptional regulator with XRE-family HTH domain